MSLKIQGITTQPCLMLYSDTQHHLNLVETNTHIVETHTHPHITHTHILKEKKNAVTGGLKKEELLSSATISTSDSSRDVTAAPPPVLIQPLEPRRVHY